MCLGLISLSMQIFKVMKRFIFKNLLFLGIIFCVDRISGKVFSYFVDNTKGGYVGHHQYINNICDMDVLVFGSSRAIHHYNSKMISDSLGLSCYNCGQDGNGIILNYGQWHMLKQRYQPKLIIYDVYPKYDLLYGDNHQYLGWLKLYYNRSGISDIFEKVDKTEKYKMHSMLYRYNYNPLQVVADFIRPIKEIDKYGFRPLAGELDTMKIRKDGEMPKSYQFDAIKLDYLEKMIQERGSTKIVFVISPSWYGTDNRAFEPLKDICSRENIPIIDFSNSAKFVGNMKFFRDGNHLNADGADEFTRDLIIKLKNYI